jgi:ATP-binding cassette subfamily B protein
MKHSQKLKQYVRPYWKPVLLAPLLMAMEVAFDLMQPRLIQRIVDQGIAHGDMALVAHACVQMVLCAIGGTIGGMGCSYFAVVAAQGAGADLRSGLFRKVQSLAFGDLDRLDTGSIITRLTSDVNQMQNFLMMLLRMMVRAPLLIVGSLIMAILTSPDLSRVLLVLVPIVALILAVVFRLSSPIYSEVQRRLDRLNTVVQENLAGVRVVKAFARRLHEIARFRDANDQLVAQNIAASRLSAVTMPFMMLTINAGVAAAVWIGGVKVIGNQMPVGHVIAFLNYLGQGLFSLMMVSMMITQISQAEASARRVTEILETQPQLAPATGAEGRISEGRVSFENVTFRYDRDEKDAVLCGVSFVAEPGETIAILGATGSGKSTLVNLVPRFYDASEGRVAIDGTDVREIPDAELRSKVAVALQEAVLFSGTLRDNIRYGRPDATEAEVVEAARIAQAAEFIDALPDGYDAVVGQRGVNLSGGQKQRIAIARALLMRPRVLILDDCTSAVDINTERRIREGLARYTTGQTVLVVAQRITAAENADRILVLDDGQLVAQGTHSELLQTSDVYREIYESQVESGVMAHA